MKHLLDFLNKIQPEITEASMFISGTLSADVNNEKAKALMGRLSGSTASHLLPPFDFIKNSL